jgi:hypothetical protein
MPETSMSVMLTGGLDAFSNLYDVLIKYPGATQAATASSVPLLEESVRVQGFTPPELTAGEYTVGYKGVKITRPNAKITGPREFTLDFRSDADYGILKKLNDWKNKVVDPTGQGEIHFGAYSAESGVPVYGEVTVKTYKALATLTADTDAVVWTFKQVICTNIGSPSFTRSGNEPTKISAKFMFMDYTIS